MKKFKKEFQGARISLGSELITKDNLTDDLYKLAIKADPKLAKMFEEGKEEEEDVKDTSFISIPTKEDV